MIKPDMTALTMLRDALRDQLPENFTWNFQYPHNQHQCGSSGCALGVAYNLGLIIISDDAKKPSNTWMKHDELVGLHFGMSERDYIEIFLSARAYKVPGRENTRLATMMSEVTPAMVADKLDAYIKEHF